MDGYTCISGNIGIIANSVIDMEGQLKVLGILGNEDVFLPCTLSAYNLLLKIPHRF